MRVRRIIRTVLVIVMMMAMFLGFIVVVVFTSM
jgi:hypothetical protein